jgi:hypothetical protein
VIAANGIVAVHALKMPGQYHSSVLLKNINQAERDALIMQRANGVFVNV